VLIRVVQAAVRPATLDPRCQSSLVTGEYTSGQSVFLPKSHGKISQSYDPVIMRKRGAAEPQNKEG
jgi:hypothetical protein